MTGSFVSVEKGIQLAGVGKFQYRLFVIFGLVWLCLLYTSDAADE